MKTPFFSFKPKVPHKTLYHEPDHSGIEDVLFAYIPLISIILMLIIGGLHQIYHLVMTLFVK